MLFGWIADWLDSKKNKAEGFDAAWLTFLWIIILIVAGTEIILEGILAFISYPVWRPVQYVIEAVACKRKQA